MNIKEMNRVLSSQRKRFYKTASIMHEIESKTEPLELPDSFFIMMIGTSKIAETFIEGISSDDKAADLVRSLKKLIDAVSTCSNELEYYYTSQVEPLSDKLEAKANEEGIAEALVEQKENVQP